MLYALLYPLADDFIIFNVFKYITFRTFGGILTAMLQDLQPVIQQLVGWCLRDHSENATHE